ncbi:MAG: DinB family protein [SAR202 cluster bacterium]|jgi:uncharacterized damage-inducible protein DinB|nr:hypothetical protein [Chloroflexota bacterium]MDP6419895.1 DinB family protein [SAR202 cluster bacterium]MDP6664153.1 DinB family protein [SAR202 cluster bacterium]MDP6800352.1 DinB family protein [SAR202 cluster bacterium]MQG58463.1 DinB family protein [SAR202 cluster bacterium]
MAWEHLGPRDKQPDPMAAVLEWGLRQAHDRLVEIVSDMSDDQLSWSPQPGAHSLGFVIWHIARCDDNYLRVHIQGRQEIWQEERWYERWSMDPESTGMLLSDDQAADLVLPAKADIVDYCRRVWNEVDDYVAGLGSSGMAQTVSNIPRTTDMTIGQIIVSHVVGHDNRHLGEMEYIKGLMGLRGSVTL